MRLSQFIDFINRNQALTDEERKQVYTHLTIGNEEIECRKKYRNSLKSKRVDSND